MTTGKEAVLVWEINGRVIGRRKAGDAAWYVPWPWTLFFTVQGGECRSETVFISRRFR